MKLVEDIAKALVDYPEEVSVTSRNERDMTILELRVAESDMGKVIGKQGRIANAIRAVVKVKAMQDNERIALDIVR